MKRKINKKNAWMYVLSAMALFYMIMGVLKIADTDYLRAAISLVTTIVFAFTAINIAKGKIKFDQPNDGLKFFFPIGFVFSVVGAWGVMSAGVWGFGITLFLIGMFFSPKKEEELKENENAG
ncbi:MAG: hypothetical protein L3J66_04330 [Bacteroidales bacterium]|nr:hypothetical protein [Bacteroidales bacterium]